MIKPLKKPVKILGSATFQLLGEERAYLINAFKNINPKTELDKRIAKRFMMKLLGHGTWKFPLYPDQECKYCENTFHYKVFKRHEFTCKEKRKEQKKGFTVDHEILNRILHDNN